MTAAAVAATTAVVAMSGVAFAAWRVTGTTTSAAVAANPTLTVTGGQVEGLYPGGARPAVLDVRNVNDFPVRFEGFAFENVTVDPAHATACPAGVVQLGDSTGAGTMLLPGQVATLEAMVRMADSAPQGCTGATFEITWLAEASVGSV